MRRFQIPDKVSKTITEIFTSRIALIIYSVLIAVIAWVAVAITINPTTTRTIKDIPVTVKSPDVDPDSTSKLQMLSHKVQTVDITVTANRSVIMSLTADDFTAISDASTATEAGTADYAISVTCTGKGIENVTVTSQNVKTDTVTLDMIESKEVNVTVNAPKIKAAKNYTFENDKGGSATPETITITGPAELLRQVDHAEVTVDTAKTLSSSYTTYTDKIKYYDSDGAEIDSENISTSQSEFVITFGVLSQKTLKLAYQIDNEPENFDEDWLKNKIELSAKTITIAANNTDMTDISTWDIGTISLADIGMNYTKTLGITIPTGYKNVSDMNSVTLSLDNSNLKSKNIVLNSIKVINPPAGYSDFKVTTESINVTLIGDPDEIDDINAKDVNAVVNLIGYKLQSLAFSYDVSITVPNHNHVWAYGNYKAAVSCKEETEATTTKTTTNTTETLLNTDVTKEPDLNKTEVN